MPKINQSVVNATPIPLPPIEAQKMAVEQYERFDALCRRLESNIRNDERLKAQLLASLSSNLENQDPDGGGSSTGMQHIQTTQLDQCAIPYEAQENSTRSSESLTHDITTQFSEQEVRAAPVDTKFQEAALVGAIVKSFFADGGEPIGNFRLQKAVYFARRHNADPSATADFLKKAAGPYNPSMKYSGGIAIAKAKNYITEARGRYGFGHIPGATIAELDPAVQRYGYGESATWVSQHFKFKKNEEWELLATVDYAMLQLRDATPADILAYVANDPEWRPKIEKLGLTEFKIESAMLEIRALFPNGNGSV